MAKAQKMKIVCTFAPGCYEVRNKHSRLGFKQPLLRLTAKYIWIFYIIVRMGSNPFPLSEWIVTAVPFFRCVIFYIVATLFHYQNGL